MKYIVTQKKFTRIIETRGTVQNASRINTVEISNQAVMNTGALLLPQEKFSFSGLTLYARCADSGGAELRVVPFMMNYGSASSITTPTTDSTDIVDDAWNGNIVTDPDADALIDEMWHAGATDTGDGFEDYLDNLFP